MKKYFLALFVVCAAFIASSCTILFSDDCSVQINNMDPNRKAYIQTVEYRDAWDSYGRWTKCWDYAENGYDDSYISFSVESGSKNFRITVIYPNYRNSGTDYYDTFVTTESTYITGWGTNLFVFDGYELYNPNASEE